MQSSSGCNVIILYICGRTSGLSGEEVPAHQVVDACREGIRNKSSQRKWLPVVPRPQYESSERIAQAYLLKYRTGVVKVVVEDEDTVLAIINSTYPLTKLQRHHSETRIIETHVVPLLNIFLADVDALAVTILDPSITLVWRIFARKKEPRRVNFYASPVDPMVPLEHDCLPEMLARQIRRPRENFLWILVGPKVLVRRKSFWVLLRSTGSFHSTASILSSMRSGTDQAKDVEERRCLLCVLICSFLFLSATPWLESLILLQIGRGQQINVWRRNVHVVSTGFKSKNEAFSADQCLNHLVSNVFAQLRNDLKIAVSFANAQENHGHILCRSMTAGLPLPQYDQNWVNCFHLVNWRMPLGPQVFSISLHRRNESL